MFDYDRSDFIRFLKDFPEQPVACRKLMSDFSLNITIGGVKNIVIAGMGGSAISGDLLLAFIQDELKVPAMVNRDYHLPAFVSDKTLFFASSYSGNTEETLSATHEALRRKATVIGISSGGELEQLCKSSDCPHFKIPGGLPPRQALGYLFFSLLFLLERLGLVAEKEEDVFETVEVLQELLERFSPQSSFGHNLANHIAQNLYHTIPIIYTAVPYFSAVPVRWRNQINENSKAMAFSNVFPELNHNEIMGWEGPWEVNRYFRVILLRDIEESARNKRRLEITKGFLRERKIPVLEVFAEGKSRLARLFSLIYTGDWTSYYLAMIHEKDPITIDSIELLKTKLKEG